ncbi:MAG: alpha-mannosidase [Planctomycetota bacterium]|jgi:alpha-mannosidase
MSKSNYIMHLVSHTHWDREWRLPWQEHRMKLVDCIDNVIRLMDEYPEYKHFQLDGQTSLVEDYLEVRPEMAERISELVKAEKLLIGPWYTLVDESLIHGESIVRNLLLGHEIGSRFENVMRVGFGISSFGHIGQLPQIFSQFGINNVIFSRGISDWQVKSEFIWESPDGTKVLGLHLPDHYTKSNWFYVVHRPAFVGVGSFDWEYQWGKIGQPYHACDMAGMDRCYRLLDPQLQYDPELITKQVAQLRDEAAEVATTQHLLFLDGVDHLEANPLLGKYLRECKNHIIDDTLIHTTLPDYIQAIEKAIDWEKLEVIGGEMRRPSREGVHNQLMGHVMSSRMHLKQRNQTCQTLLTKITEPFVTIAWLNGAEYPRSLLGIAWRHLCQNHAHDSICGCSVDQVHKDMMYRFDQAELISEELTQRAFWYLIPRIDYSSLDDKEIALTLFNPLPYVRSEVVKLAIDIPAELDATNFTLRNSKGEELPYQVVEVFYTFLQAIQPLNAQQGIHANRYIAYVPAEDIPALGHTTLIVTPETKFSKRQVGSLVPESNVLENDNLRVKINPNGTLDVTDKAQGRTFCGLHYFEDRGDAGSAWVYQAPYNDTVINSRGCSAKIALVEDGPVRACYRVSIDLDIPEGLAPGEPLLSVNYGPKPAARSQRTITHTITSYISLIPKSKRVEIETHFSNQARDHKLRVCFPSGITDARVSSSESQFDVIDRPIELPDTSDWIEPAYEDHPQLGFVDVNDSKSGLAIINEGLPEYAVLDDGPRTICVTLLRAVRPFFVATHEGSQCLQDYVYRYAILPHAGTWQEADVFQASLEHNTPIKAILTRKGNKNDISMHNGCLEVKPSNLILSAMMRSEDGESIVLRLYNPTPNAIKGMIIFGHRKIISAQKVNFLEEPIEELELNDSESISLAVEAKRIVTLKVKVG